MSDKKNIRIKDIAMMSGVSVGTVDRVLHNRGKVAEDVKKKIEDVLEKTGYKPNLIARTLGSNKPLKIAALIPNPIQDEYWSLSESGILQSQEEWSQYNIAISSYFFDLYDSSSFKATAAAALKSTPDGILAAPIFYRESINLFEELRQAKIPYVLFNTNIPEASPISFIGQNLYQSGMVGGELLAFGDKKKKNIIVFHIYEDVANSIHLKEKERGIRDYFKGQDVTVHSLDLSNPDEKHFEEQVYKAVSQSDLKGILVSTSKATHIVATLLEKFGLRDIPLIGYDLLEKNLSHLRTGTINFLINQNPKRMAKVGISHLINYLMFHKTLPPKELFPLEIITRQNLESYLNSTTL